MMKKLLLKTMLLLCALIAGSGTMWGDPIEALFWDGTGSAVSYTEGYTYVKSEKGDKKSGYFQDSGTAGSTVVSFSVYHTTNKLFSSTPSTVIFTAGLGGGSAKDPLDNAVRVCFLDKDGKDISGSETVVTTKILGKDASEFSVQMPTEKAANAYGVKLYHTKESSYNVRYYTFSLSYEEGSSSSSAVATTTTIDATGITNTDVYVSTAAGSLAAAVTVTEGGVAVEGATVTWSGDNDAVATINESTGAVTLVGAGTVTFTATYAGVEDEYESSSATYEMTVTDTTPIPTHSASFSVNGETTSQNFEEGAVITFPANPADVNGMTFVGWVTEAIDGTTDDAPEFVTSANMGNSDVTFYAVFAEANVSGPTEVTKSYGFETESDSDWTIDGPVRTEGEGNTGSYAGKINTHNTYVTYNSKVKVKKFSFAFKRTSTNSNYNVYIETSEDNSTWTAAETYAMSSFTNGSYLTKTKEFDGTKELYVRFHCNQTTAVRYVDDISITYVVAGGITYSGYCTTVAAAVAVTGVSVDATATVNVGETTTLTATVSPDNATNKNVTWASSDEAIATVDANGVVTGVAAGEATITVTSVADNTKTADCTVTVTAVAVTGITVDETASVNVGKTTTLTATVSPDNATNKNVTWESSDEAIATVDANGVVTGVAAGEATITVASVADNTKTASCTVTVSVAPGAAARPYTVAEAIDAIDNGGDVTDVYVEGVISQIDSYSSTYHSLTYWISADGTTEAQQFEVYSGKGIDGANFSSIDDLEIGDRVVVKGNIKKYNNIYEFDYNNQLVSRTEKPASDLAKTSDIDLDVKNNALTASVADYISSSSTGAYTYESADETVATVSAEGVVTGLKVGTTTITVNQAATLSYKAGTVEIFVTVADTRVDATTIPAINISSLSTDDEEGTISVVDPVKADEGVTFSFESSDEDVLLIEGDEYFVIEIGTTTVTVTATASNSDLYKNVTKTFEVTVNAAEKSENVIAFDFESYSTEYGTNLEGVVGGSTGFDGEITATSSNPSVLTVAIDAEGNVTVTPVAVGSATVTFSAAETTSFLAAEDVQQVFTVTAPEGTAIAPANGFVKVTATEDITNGEYLIVYEDGEVAFDGSLETLDATGNTIDVEITDGVIAATNDTKAATFTIDVTAGTIQSKSGYYIGKEVNLNGLDSDAATQYTHSFKIDETGDAVITASGNCVLKYNSGSNQNRFRYYKSGQQGIQLYKLTEATATITLNTSGYATFCSQYPLDFSTAAGYTAWQITAIEGETITFGKITGTIKGGQGILLKGEAGETITLTSADSEKELNDNLLFGTTAPTYIPANEYYGLSGNKFVKVNAGTVPAGKALLPATAIPAGARELKLVFEDENTTTGIRTIENAEMRTENAVYDLQGRKVTKPVKGGLYIENGLKFVKK